MAFTREEVAKVYVATFNRAPDTAGLNYWMNDSGFTNIEDVASSFFDSAEAQEMYPAGTSSTQMVEAAYQNLFGRDSDADGLAYWVGELDAGRFSQSLMLQAMIGGAKDTAEYGNDKTMMQNKTTVGLDFANANIPDEDKVLAKSVMSGVTDDAQTVTDAQVVITTNLTQTADVIPTNEFKFTTQWLEGKTLYNVYDDNEDGVYNDMTPIAYSEGVATGDGFEGGETKLNSYHVDDNGIIVMMDTDGISYVSGLAELTDLNAIELIWSEEYSYALSASKQEAQNSGDFEYFFLSQESANSFMTESSNEAPETTSIHTEGFYAGEYGGIETGQIAIHVYSNGDIDGAVYSYTDDETTLIYGEIDIQNNIVNMYTYDADAVGTFVDLDTIHADWTDAQGGGGMVLELVGTNEMDPYSYLANF
jgi:hypothetical protein